MPDHVESARPHHALIHEILLEEWDPIGISHIREAQDEYNAYVGEVYRLLARNVSQQEIFDYLWWVETQHMGLLGDRQRTEKIAEKLAHLVVKSKRHSLKEAPHAKRQATPDQEWADATMDTTFAHSYECERLTEAPSLALPHFYYPGASTQGGRDGLLVKVRPVEGKPWFGTFAFGQIAPRGASGIFTTPSPHRLCVVARGDGYIVSANAPSSWEPVRAAPIVDVRPIRARGLIVFASFTDLVAYGPTGIAWRTERLAWDDLRITEVTDAFIKGEFWDFRKEALASFTVDLSTGVHQGGITAS